MQIRISRDTTSHHLGSYGVDSLQLAVISLDGSLGLNVPDKQTGRQLNWLEAMPQVGSRRHLQERLKKSLSAWALRERLAKKRLHGWIVHPCYELFRNAGSVRPQRQSIGVLRVHVGQRE